MTSQQPGTEIAGYRIESLIGRGGMAVVYRAEDLRLGRKVALKLLSPQLADSEEFRQRFIRESRLAASLDHPNIIPIYEAGEADGQLFIAMRYVQGSDLKGLVTQGGPLPVDRTLRLLGQIGDALDTAHRAGLVHRDVKPANVLVAAAPEQPRSGAGGHVYLTDFGLTKRTAEMSGGLTGTGHFLGTVDYVSPEQIQGKQAGPATDIYALGCLLYECLTGQLPYRRDDDAALLWAHLVEPPPPVTAIRPELPAAVNAVVRRAMAKDPADRYQSCQELVGELEQALRTVAPEPVTGGRHAVGGGAAIGAGGVMTDGPGPEPGTGAGDAPTGRHHPPLPSDVVVPLPAQAGTAYDAAPAGDRPDLEEAAGADREQDDREEDDREQDEAGAHSAVPPILAGLSPAVAAAGATSAVATKGPRPSGWQRRRLAQRLIIVAALVLAMGVGAVGVSLFKGGEAMSVAAEAADAPGDYPFTTPPTDGTASSGSTPTAAAAPDGSPPGTLGPATGKAVGSNSAVPVSGDTVGLYGGTGAQACDTEMMATFFDTHQDKAAAWAAAQHIQTSEIRPFLKSLTPVVLRTDTAVTNHGFRNGKANAYQSVLQAGTAVLVDERGAPRVRCACGNPLNQPAARQRVRYTGPKWPELQRRPVTVIRPAPVTVQHFVVVLVQQNTTVVLDRPRGTAGEKDQPAPPEVADKALKFPVDDPAAAASSSGTSPRAGRTGAPGTPSSEPPSSEPPSSEPPSSPPASDISSTEAAPSSVPPTTETAPSAPSSG